ncbi:unnamed protein product [Owenia fusiformis]|uniref:N-alpha-acetyltransferase 60 n=1 Tax=Owenia fusiformis TaxID=6347 RepID=A0A8J1UNN1_OWEFU|nr:unnamed protein product [Owenia fusiformis]
MGSYGSDQSTVSFSLQHEVQLRFLTPQDIDVVKQLCHEWFPIEYPEQWYQDITSNPKFYSLAATYNTQIVGMIICEVKPRIKCNREDMDILANHFIASTQVAYILSLGVLNDFRRHGIASLLLDTLLSYLSSSEMPNVKAVYLHVLTTNSVAIGFYERRYFKVHSYLPYYYSINGSPRDGYSYVLYINGGTPPWTLLDYAKQLGTFVSSLQPCNVSQRLVRSAKSLWQKIVSGSSH